MTKKYVLTGGPSCGKTSLIIGLELQGEAIVREVATDYIYYKQCLGIRYPWEEKDFQVNMLKLQLQREAHINKNLDRVFLDRGLLDAIPYYELANQPLDALMESVIKQMQVERVYEKVFIIEHSGFIEDSPIRRENLEQALSLEKLHEQVYRDYGYETIRIPYMHPERRIEMILSYIINELFI